MSELEKRTESESTPIPFTPLRRHRSAALPGPVGPLELLGTEVPQRRVDPLAVVPDYAPMIEDELLKPLSNPADEDLLFLLVMTVPADMTKVTANMKAPVIINTKTCTGVQLIVDNADYPVKYNVYDAVQKMKEKAGE